jgi:hypothetical protein
VLKLPDECDVETVIQPDAAEEPISIPQVESTPQEQLKNLPRQLIVNCDYRCHKMSSLLEEC